MKNRNWETIFLVVILVITVGAIAASITALVMYGNKPITEIPAWALMFMIGRGGK